MIKRHQIYFHFLILKKLHISGMIENFMLTLNLKSHKKVLRNFVLPNLTAVAAFVKEKTI